MRRINFHDWLNPSVTPRIITTQLVNLSNQIQLRERASYSYCARSWRQQTNPSRKIIFHRVENVLKLIHKLKKLRIFRALQTSRVLHISMNERWRMNQLLMSKRSY